MGERQRVTDVRRAMPPLPLSLLLLALAVPMSAALLAVAAPTIEAHAVALEAKYLTGRTVALLVLALLLPLMAAIALAVRCTSRGPVLFRQRRVGQGGEVFEMLKFRSMRIAA